MIRTTTRPARTTIPVTLTLPPATYAALRYLADVAAGGTRPDLGPVITGLARAELAKASPGAWEAMAQHIQGQAWRSPKDLASELYGLLHGRPDGPQG